MDLLQSFTGGLGVDLVFECTCPEQRTITTTEVATSDLPNQSDQQNSQANTSPVSLSDIIKVSGIGCKLMLSRPAEPTIAQVKQESENDMSKVALLTPLNFSL